MFYSETAIIKQMQHKYKLSERKAKRLYNQYKEKGELDIIISLLFRNKEERTV